MKWNYKHPAVETLLRHCSVRHCWDIVVETFLSAQGSLCVKQEKSGQEGELMWLSLPCTVWTMCNCVHHVHHVQLCICVTHRRDIKFANAICYHSIHRNQDPSALWWYFDQSEPTMRKSYNVTVGIQVVLIVQYVPVEVLDVTRKIAVMVLEVTCKMTLEVTHMMTLLLANGTWPFSSTTHRCR